MTRFVRRLLISVGDLVISVGDYIYNYDLWSAVVMTIGLIIGLIMLCLGY
jgi:hypothetical protein